MTDRRMAEHVGDDELVRLIDGELAAAERTQVDAHIAACDACAARLDGLRGRSAALRALLGGPAPAVPDASLTPTRVSRRGAERSGAATPRRGRRTLLAVAAVLLVAALTPPVYGAARRWIEARRAADAAIDAGAAARGATVPTPVVPADSGTVTSIRFVPAGVELRLRFAAADSAAVLAVARADGREVVVEARAAGAVPIVVLPDGVEVRNGQVPGARFRVTVPAGVRAVRVAVGDGASIVLREVDLREGERTLRLDGVPPP